MATIIEVKQGITHIELALNKSTREYQFMVAISAPADAISDHLFIDRFGKKRIIIHSTFARPSYLRSKNAAATAVSGIVIYGPAVLLTADETEDYMKEEEIWLA